MIRFRPRQIASIACAFVLIGLAPHAAAQQPAGKPAAPQSEADARTQVLESEAWRRAMFELAEWFRTQTIYTREEATRMRADFNARVAGMSAAELKEMLGDMEAKFRILNVPELQETRAWFAQYMAVLADRRREELLREIPDFPKMTAKELQQAISRIQQKKGAQARFGQGSQARAAAQKQANRDAKVAARDTRRQRSYRSPYRPTFPAASAASNRQFDDHQVGPGTSMSIDPLGGVWVNIGW